jgi:hypothetical protein
MRDSDVNPIDLKVTESTFWKEAMHHARTLQLIWTLTTAHSSPLLIWTHHSSFRLCLALLRIWTPAHLDSSRLTTADLDSPQLTQLTTAHPAHHCSFGLTTAHLDSPLAHHCAFGLTTAHLDSSRYTTADLDSCSSLQSPSPQLTTAHLWTHHLAHHGSFGSPAHPAHPGTHHSST